MDWLTKKILEFDRRPAYKKTRGQQAIITRADCLNKMDRCRNCHMACEGNLCRICRDLGECRQFGRRLQQSLFTLSHDVCDACMRKRQSVRTAVERVVEEREFATSELDVDLHVFLDEHEADVVRVLEDAVNQRR